MTKFMLPKDHRPFIDKYFLRAKEILKKENLNPMVKCQVFIRKGDCNIFGIDEAIAILTKYSDIEKTGKLWALKEGSKFAPKESVIIFEAPIQSIIDLETMYLGVLSSETTLKNGGEDISLSSIEGRMRKIVALVGNRPVSYFGARHWRYDRDADISKACFCSGAKSCSTDIGAKTFGRTGIGTIPHALEAVYHWKYGLWRAVVEATKAFDKYMDKKISRIALIDYSNQEIKDTIAVAKEVKALDGIRIDTCGENIMEGCFTQDRGVSLKGVISFVYKMLGRNIRNNIKIMLSSGFGNPDKVKQFTEFENKWAMRLFDGLGVGGVFDSRMATMDIVSVGGEDIHKKGREFQPNNRLEKVI